jgi:hypothetical protein
MPCYIDDMFKASVPTAESKPPNPKIEEIHHRWQAAASPFEQVNGVEDAVVKPGLLLPPQSVLDSVARKGATLFQHYQVNPPPSIQQPLKLTDALAKVTYGKLFQDGFPVAYETRCIRVRHVREELAGLLQADPKVEWHGGRGRAFVDAALSSSPLSEDEEGLLDSFFRKLTVLKPTRCRSLLTEGIVEDDQEDSEDEDDSDDGSEDNGENPEEEWNKPSTRRDSPVVPPRPAPRCAILDPLPATATLLPVPHEFHAEA